MIKLKHLFTLFLLFGLLCPLEILGQYASPSLDPTISSLNPAVIPWRTKSTISFFSKTTNVELGSPSVIMEEKITENSAIFGIAGDLVPEKVRTGFEIQSLQKYRNRTDHSFSKLDDSNSFYDKAVGSLDIKRNFVDKSAGASIGSFSLGYTEVTTDTVVMDIKNDLRSYYDNGNKRSIVTADKVEKWKSKIERTGATIRLGKKDNANLFIGQLRLKNSRYEYKYDTKWVFENFSSSGVKTNTSFISNYYLDEIVKNTTVNAIGYKNGINNDTRYRLEIYKGETPKVFFNMYYDNNTKESDYYYGKKNFSGFIFELGTNHSLIKIATEIITESEKCNYTPAIWCSTYLIPNYTGDKKTTISKIFYSFIIDEFRITLSGERMEMTYEQADLDTNQTNRVAGQSKSYGINLGYEL